jgi:formylglycine-generating enzyme required for sulfatase activity
VVLVTWADAAAYCAWRGAVVGQRRRLPSAAEYEKAARGPEGSVYPWGSEFASEKLNSQVSGPKDTMAAGSFPGGASPYGMLDAAGNVFQWTATPWPHKRDGMTVKGSAWDDFAGVGRGASLHGRKKHVRHVIVGFRCAADR